MTQTHILIIIWGDLWLFHQNKLSGQPFGPFDQFEWKDTETWGSMSKVQRLLWQYLYISMRSVYANIKLLNLSNTYLMTLLLS